MNSMGSFMWRLSVREMNAFVCLCPLLHYCSYPVLLHPLQVKSKHIHTELLNRCVYRSTRFRCCRRSTLQKTSVNMRPGRNLSHCSGHNDLTSLTLQCNARHIICPSSGNLQAQQHSKQIMHTIQNSEYESVTIKKLKI